MLLTEEMRVGGFLSLPSVFWLVMAITIPILHQAYVWFVWRSELHYGLMSSWFGKKLGFYLYAFFFGILFMLRLVTIVGLAIANQGSLKFDRRLSLLIAVILFVPWLYLIYSVYRYFGVKRALGIDHFDQSYRHMPLVNKGIFRYTPNGMYIFGFFIFWIPGLIWLSPAALLAALFSHTYIWVHYYTTELPDMRLIYKEEEMGKI